MSASDEIIEVADAARPGINPALLRQYFNAPDREWGFARLLSVFDFHRRNMERAEELSRAYLAQMTRLEARLNARTERPADRGPAAAREPSDTELSRGLRRAARADDTARARSEIARADDLDI